MSRFTDWLQKKKFQFYFVHDEDADFHFVAFGHRNPGFIDDGWDLRDEDKDEWDEVEHYGEIAHTLLGHDAIGFECYSCSYEIEEKNIPVLREYFLRLGMTEGTPAW